MALTKVSGDFIQDGSITQGHLHSSHGITTSHIAEGDKLFFTNARVDSRIGSLSSSDLSEGTNLYYTDARARAAISGTGSLSYNSTTGVMSFTMPAQNTSNITEGSNLYYTDARADARITAANTDSLSEGSTNLYYTDARADARVALIVDSAPGTLNTLNELAAALGDDANFSTTVTNSIATKLPLAGGTLTGNLTISGSNTLEVFGFLYTRSTLRVLNAAGTGWHNWATRGGGKYDLNVNNITSAAITASGNVTGANLNISNWDTAYGWGDHGVAGYLTSFDITTQTDAKYLRSNADDTASGILTLTKNTATGLANNAFSHAKTVIGGLHFANGNGPAANNGNQAAITFQGGTASEAQAGIYVHNNNSQGTHMLFATTDSYSNGPKAGITLLNNGNVTIRGTVGASNFSGSSSGTNTGDQDLSSYATSATTLAGYGITNAIEKGAQIASAASWTTATRFGSTGDLSQAAGNHALSVRSENNNDAFMSFHIGSDYAVHFGLDGASNRMHVGGWSEGTGTQYQLYDSRDFSVASVLNSNVTLASLGALSTSGKAADSNLLDGKDHTQFGATLATYGTTAGSSGRIRCTAPFNTNSAHMFQIMISLYGSYTQHTYIVSAYMYASTNQWYSPQAVYLGTGSPDIIVGRDSNGKAYISIANGNYMGVRVHNMTRGFQTSVADTYDPWTITVDAGTENSVTPSIYKTWTSGNDGSGSGLDADLLDGQHASAFQAAGNYAPAGGSYSTDWYVDDLYHDAWVRNHTNNNGHYWETSGWHLYPKDADDFYMRSGSGSCALVMTIGNETARGYVYANGSSEIGFLNNTRSWSLRVDNSGNAFATASYRAPIFYDSNNTGYYLNPASTSNLNAATFAGDITVNGNQVITLGGNADVKFSVWSGTTYGIGMTSGVTLGNLNDYAMTFCMNNDADRGFWWGYSGQSKGAGAMSLTTNGKLYVTTHVIAPIYYDTNTAYYMDAASTANLNAVTLNYINYKNSNFRVGDSTTMNAITSGGQNVAFGPEALGACNTGTRNFAYGYAALAALTSGANNIAMGDAAGYNVTTGSNNLLFGISAGRTGYQSPQSIAGVTTHNHQIHMGNESHTTARIQVSWTVNSDARDKTDITPIDIGLDFVKQLNPVTYRWDKRSDYEDRTPDGTNKLPELTLGFLAQEVEVVEKSFGYDVANQTNLVVDRIPEQDHYGITYEKMVPILTKAIQEQQTIIDDLKSRLETLENN